MYWILYVSMGFHMFGNDILKQKRQIQQLRLSWVNQYRKRNQGYQYWIIKHKNFKVQDTKIQYQTRIWKSRFVFHPTE